MDVKEVVVGVVKKDGKYLMLKHNKCKGLYLFPSGKVEETDLSEHEALKREMFEEVGIKVTQCKYCYSSPAWYDRTDGIMHTKEHIYIIEEYVGTSFNKEPNKHEEMVWVEPKEVFRNPQNFTYITYLLMRNLENRECDEDESME